MSKRVQGDTMSFAGPEDRATLASDPSAVAGGYTAGRARTMSGPFAPCRWHPGSDKRMVVLVLSLYAAFSARTKLGKSSKTQLFFRVR